MKQLGYLIAALVPALAVSSFAGAQQPANEPTTEERVVALERALADLDKRVQGRGSAAPGALASSDVALAGRIEQLERAVDRFSGDLQRVERQADNALREAAEGPYRGERRAARARRRTRALSWRGARDCEREGWVRRGS